MYQRINRHDFIEAFRTMGRYDRADGQGGNFTYEALLALFGYLEETLAGENCPMGIELDVIGLCCDFAEYDCVEDLASEYDNNDDLRGLLELAAESTRPADFEQVTDELLDWFRDRTTVIEIPGTDRIIIQQF